MNDVGMKINVRKHFKNCTGEESESFSVVIMTVESASLEIIFVINKIVCTVIPSCPEQTAILMTPCNRHGKVCDEVHGVFKFLRNCAVKRNNNSAILTFSAKCMGKTSRYIGKSAASAKRISF